MGGMNRSAALFLAVGIILLFGLNAVIASLIQPLVWDNILVKIVELIGGSFLVLFAFWVFAWGVSDETGENATKFLKDIWNKLFKHLNVQKG